MITAKESRYDVVVIGSGPSGRTVSTRLAKNQLSVALVENELVGGDCHYWACIPSKAMLRPPEALSEAREVEGSKQATQGILSVKSVLTRRDKFVDDWNDSNLANTLQKGGIDIIRGLGELYAPLRVIVTSNNDASGTNSSNGNGSFTKMMLIANYAVVLCTGSSAVVPLQVQGLVEAKPWTSRNATSAKKSPRSLAIMGDGAVACEMAHAWWALGTKEITIISRHKGILNKYEPFVGERLSEIFKQRGISILNNANVREVEHNTDRSNQQNGRSILIKLDNGNSMTAEELLVAVGRRPNTDKLGLETVGLKSGDWLDVDDTCLVRSVNGDWLYAVGDINHRALLTHIGKYQARACAAAIITRAEGNHLISDGAGDDSRSSSHSFNSVNSDPPAKWLSTSDHMVVPQVIFTDPQIASVGLTEQRARSLKINVRAVDCEIGTLEGAKLHTDDYNGHARILVDEDRRIIVGATFIGPQVAELLHSATISIVGKVSLDRLWHAVPSFPTMSEVWVRLLETYGF
jgi:pyruvate/2-oxoglutarate dehydrogenase complex dihydrolipoamide dehydrogenase (E3) component